MEDEKTTAEYLRHALELRQESLYESMIRKTTGSYRIKICNECGAVMIERIIHKSIGRESFCHNCLTRINTNDCDDLFYFEED